MTVEADRPGIRQPRAPSAIGRVVRNRWFSGSAGLLAVKMLNAALGLATVVLFARFLGDDDYGRYVLVITISQFLSLPLNMGLPTLLVREIAIGVREGRFGVVKGIQRFSLILVAVGSLVLIAVAAAGYLVATGAGLYQPDAGLLPMLLLSAATIPVMALLNCTRGVLAGFRNVVQSRVPDGIVRPALLLAAGGAALWLWHAGPAELVAIYLASAAVALLHASWLIRRAQPAAVAAASLKFESRAWLGTLLPLTGISAISMVNGYLDILMLGAISTTTEVAQYRIAAQIGLFPLVFRTIGIALLSPRIAAANVAGEFDDLRRVVTLGNRAMLAGTTVFFLILLLAGRPAIDFAFGSEYLPAFWPAVVLSFGTVLSTTFGAASNVLTMMRLERTTIRLTSLGAVVNICINLALIPFIGALGAAIATAVTIGGTELAASLALRQRLGSRVDAFASTRT